MKFVGFECSLDNSYSHDSFPLSVKEVFIGSPYSWRTCAWVVLPLSNCPDTVCCEASAMLSLPLLAHPPRNADESPAATTIRHVITPPNTVAPGTAAHQSKDDVARCQLEDTVELDLEVSHAVAIDVPADDGHVVCGASLIERLVTQLAGFAVKRLGADELECLVARAAGVRIDIREINMVRSRLEVGDDIANAGPDRSLVDRINWKSTRLNSR